MKNDECTIMNDECILFEAKEISVRGSEMLKEKQTKK